MSGVSDRGSGGLIPFWVDSRFQRSPSVHFVSIGSGAILFCERTQRLFALNPTAEFIWFRMSDGLSCREIAQELEQQGTSSQDSMAFVINAVDGWLREGYVAPGEVTALLGASPTAWKNLSIGALAARVQFFGAADPRESDKVFGHFPAHDREPSLTVDVVRHDNLEFVFSNHAPAAMTDAGNSIPVVKAILTEAFCDSVTDGFVAHGALVSFRGKRVLLNGPPGAGKSTLTLALAASGFSYASDDIVHIERSGKVAGVEFAAAAKSGAWDLLAPYVPQLSSLPTFRRTDGQLARYVLPERLDRDGSQPLDVVILLTRSQRAAAELTRLSPLDALQALIESGYSPLRRLEAETLEGLAAQLSQAACYRLSYGDLGSAVAAVSGAV